MGFSLEDNIKVGNELSHEGVAWSGLTWVGVYWWVHVDDLRMNRVPFKAGNLWTNCGTPWLRRKGSPPFHSLTDEFWVLGT